MVLLLRMIQLKSSLKQRDRLGKGLANKAVQIVKFSNSGNQNGN
jgi:hypothetical protein